MARPTDYGPQIVEQAEAFLQQCVESEQLILPTIEGLSLHLEISRETLYQWEKIHPEFSDILDELRALQASTLIQRGLTGKYNSTITKLMLSKHGYVERQDVTTNGKDLPQPIMNVQRDNSDAEDKASTQED